MRRLIYSMGVSLDGYIADADGRFDWAAPDEELHRFHNAQTRELGVHLLGRRLYETMVYWETAEQNPAAGDVELEFAEIWKPLEKVVFSATLERVKGNSRLAERDVVTEVQELLTQPGGDVAVGGATLAAALIERDLIDEYRLFINPALAGGGTRFFSTAARTLDLELLETRTFSSRVVYARYRSRR